MKTKSQSSERPSPPGLRKLAALALAASTVVVAATALSGCDRKPSAPPKPTSMASEGPTAASGGAPSNEYPAGIKPAASGDQVAAAGTDKGPSEGATAIGGMTSGQAATSGTGGATAPSGGDGRPAPK